MKKIFVLMLLCSICLVGCNSESDTANKEEKKELIVGGSTSVQPLMEEVAASFMEESDFTVAVQGGGSSVGTKGAMEGTLDVGAVSRDLKDDEKAELDGTIIALDGIVVIVNTENKLENITLQQLADIYTGKITNWKEVGGADAAISVVSREEGSGTRDGFESIVGFESEDLMKDSDIQNATGGVISTVSTNANSIGYISMGSVSDQVDVLRVEEVTPSVETVKDGSYKLQRPFVLAVKKQNEDAKALFDYIFSDAGKKIIEEMKYIPVEK